MSEGLAVVPISTALILRTVDILFAEEEHYQEVKQYLGECGYEGRLTILNIPDMYSYDAPEIHEFLDEKYKVEV